MTYFGVVSAVVGIGLANVRAHGAWRYGLLDDLGFCDLFERLDCQNAQAYTSREKSLAIQIGLPRGYDLLGVLPAAIGCFPSG
jgi:hypothetical protein